ncbi:molecular chaperone DnaJ [Lignipirellula cremea]|uniref:Chaperone protein DnaJ n=1 Tax=Lignipirellula cremea TaxID=2528010 RepID=A0A518DXV4_9BACT|nr:Chaperone protein DnaJ [Lignipirellula cremea]
MAKRCFYEVLEVTKTATDREISVAYRKAAIRYHPDSNPGDPEVTEKFKEAAEAYEVLSDPNKRARYDQYGHAGLEGGAGASQFHDVQDIFEAFGDLFGGGAFGDLFGGGGGRSRRPRKGRDIRADVTLTLEEAFRGVEKELTFNRNNVCDACEGNGSQPGAKPETCRTCHGHGQVIQQGGILRVQTTCPSCRGAGVTITDPCRECRGRGYQAQRVTLTVNIPAGVDTGMRVRLAGEGEPSAGGGQPGDCYCFINVKQHHLFQRDGDHLVLRLPISYCQATLGAEIEVPTLSGRATLTVPKGSQSGEVFRLRGRGMPDPQSGRQGDLAVQTYIETPRKLTTRQEELLRELAELEHVHVTPHRKSFLEKIRDYFTGSPEEDEEASEE